MQSIFMTINNVSCYINVKNNGVWLKVVELGGTPEETLAALLFDSMLQHLVLSYNI